MAGQESQGTIETRLRVISARLEPADLFFGVSVLGALAAAAVGATGEAIFFVLTCVAMFGLRRLDLHTAFELSVAAGIVLQGWGNALLLFERIDWYDKAVHFLTPLLMVPALYLLLARSGVVAPPRANGLRHGILGVFVVTSALGVALAAGWELVEASADRWLATNMAHGYFETMADLYSSLLGSLAAGALLTWLALTGRDVGTGRWPAKPLFEDE